MATTVDVSIGLTLSLKGRIKGCTQYEFIRPEIAIKGIEVGGKIPVKKQLEVAKKAIKPVWDLVDEQVEALLDEQFDEVESSKPKKK